MFERNGFQPARAFCVQKFCAGVHPDAFTPENFFNFAAGV